MTEWRENNLEKARASVRHWNKENRAKCKGYLKKYLKKRDQVKRDMLKEIKTHYGCMNPECAWSGELPSCCLDFHHIDASDKCFSVGNTSKGIKRVSEEINKCTVVCAICHRKITWGEMDGSMLTKCQVSECGKPI